MAEDPHPDDPLLLKRLLATVDDARIFDAGDGSSVPYNNRPDPVPIAEHRAHLRKIFRELYTNTAYHWHWTFNYDDELSHLNTGLKLFLENDELVGCGVEDFRAAIRLIAEGHIVTRADKEVSVPEKTSQDDRDFLYFMMGYMALGQHQAMKQLYWDKKDKS